MLAREEFADDLADQRRAAETATDEDAGAGGAVGGIDEFNADIMDAEDAAVFGRTAEGDLELARQEGELGMEG